MEHSGQVPHIKTGQAEAPCHSQRWVLQQYSNISLDEEAFNAKCRATFGEFKAKSIRLVVANDNTVLI